MARRRTVIPHMSRWAHEGADAAPGQTTVAFRETVAPKPRRRATRAPARAPPTESPPPRHVKLGPFFAFAVLAGLVILAAGIWAITVERVDLLLPLVGAAVAVFALTVVLFVMAARQKLSRPHDFAVGEQMDKDPAAAKEPPVAFVRTRRSLDVALPPTPLIMRDTQGMRPGWLESWSSTTVAYETATPQDAAFRMSPATDRIAGRPRETNVLCTACSTFTQLILGPLRPLTIPCSACGARVGLLGVRSESSPIDAGCHACGRFTAIPSGARVDKFTCASCGVTNRLRARVHAIPKPTEEPAGQRPA